MAALPYRETALVHAATDRSYLVVQKRNLVQMLSHRLTEATILPPS